MLAHRLYIKDVHHLYVSKSNLENKAVCLSIKAFDVHYIILFICISLP